MLEAAEMLDSYVPIDVNNMRNFNTIPEYELNAIVFFAGYIAYKVIEKTPCADCELLFCKDLQDSSSSAETYTKLREYKHSEIMNKENVPAVGFLTRPTDIFTRIVHCQLEAFDAHHDSVWHLRKLGENLLDIAEKHTSSLFKDWFDKNDKCYEHRIKALQFLLRVKIYAKTKEHNHNSRHAAKKNVLTANPKLRKVQNL